MTILIFAIYYAQLLEQSDASVAVAQSVRGAVQAFRRCPAHAVITDIRLGNSDGYRLLEAIRECNAEYRGVTPVVALTPEQWRRDSTRVSVSRVILTMLLVLSVEHCVARSI